MHSPGPGEKYNQTGNCQKAYYFLVTFQSLEVSLVTAQNDKPIILSKAQDSREMEIQLYNSILPSQDLSFALDSDLQKCCDMSMF